MHAKPIDRRIIIFLALFGALTAAVIAVMVAAGHHVVPVLEVMHFHAHKIAHAIAMHYHG